MLKKLFPLLFVGAFCIGEAMAAQPVATPLGVRAPRPVLNDLQAKAAEQGRVRVIVGLNVAFTAEGRLPNQAAVNAQRNAIRSRREAMLRGLAGRDVGVTGSFTSVPYVALEVSANALKGLLKSPHAISIEEDKPVEATLNGSVPVINAPAAWAAGYSGSGQAVAILDTGVDSSHASFTTGGNRVVSEACYSSDYSNGTYTSVSVCPGGVNESTAAGSGIDCVAAAAGYSSAQSSCTHGTHVAGIAAGNDGGSYIGVARDADIISIQVFSLFTEGVSTPNMLSYSSDQIKGLERVFALKDTYNIAAVNMSLGGGKYTDQASCDGSNASVKAAIDNLRSVGIATVIASANNGYVDALGAPACISSAVSVGATTDADAVASFSNIASFLDLLAPGRYIYAPVPGGFASKSGTSMAAPHVAGAWALLKQASSGLSVDDALNAFLFTGVSIDDQRTDGTVTGMRRIDAGAAVDYVTPGVPGIIAGPANGLVTTEAGGTAEVSYVLKTQPSADVTINLSTSDAQEASVSPGFMVFTSQNWDQAQVATLTGIDDQVDDGDAVYRLLVDGVTSTDLDYDGMSVAEAWAKNLNDDFSGVSVSAAPNLATAEDGSSVSFDVVLDVIPGADVTVSLSSSDPSEGSVSPASLLFSDANWDTPRTVTVSGVDDVDYDGHVVYKISMASTSTDANYNIAEVATVAIENRDDDASCAVYSSSDVPKLISDTEVVSVSSTLAISGASRISDINLVKINGQHDWFSDLTFALTSPAGTFASLMNESCGWMADFNFNLDDEAAGLAGDWPCPPTDGGAYVPESPLSVFDGEMPNGTWTLTVNDAFEWDGGSLDGWGLQICNAPGVAVSPRAGLRTSEAGESADFSVVLHSQPAADVSIDFVSGDATEGTVSPSSLTFTSSDWDQPQSVTVTGVDDGETDGDVYYNILDGVTVSADAPYNGVSVAGVSLFNEDDEMSCAVYPSSDLPKTILPDAENTVTSSLTLTGAGRIGDINVVNLHGKHTYVGDLQFVLQSPAGTQVSFIDWLCEDEDDFNLNLDDQAPGDAGGWPCPPVGGGTYKPDNPLSAFNGENADGTWTLSVIDWFSWDGGSLDGWGLRICALPGVTITPASGLSTSEAGATANFSVELDSPPSAPVTLDLQSDNNGEATASPASLSFDSGNWYLPKSVTLTGVDDDIDDGDTAYTIITQAAQSSDPNYNGLDPLDVTASNTDDDSAGISLIGAAGLTTSEAGGGAGFGVVLDSQPLADVTIALSSSDASEGTVSPASLRFTPGNWNSAQSVSLTGVDDRVDDGDIAYTIVLQPAQSGDSLYNGLDAPDVALSNTDNDTAGIRLDVGADPTTSEAGGTAGFSIVLSSEPLADVTIALSSSDTGEGTVSPASLRFTPVNWSSAQSVTVTGVDDEVPDEDVQYSIVTAPAVSGDPNYNGFDIADVSVRNLNDDLAEPQDLNTDGNTDSLDLGVMMSQWGGGPGSSADLNNDGTVNEIDMQILLDAMR